MTSFDGAALDAAVRDAREAERIAASARADAALERARATAAASERERARARERVRCGQTATTSRDALAARRRREEEKRFDPRAAARREASRASRATVLLVEDASDDGASAVEHDAAWRAFEARVVGNPSFVVTYADVPWPPSGEWLAREALRTDDADVSRASRAIAKRWHPDKFIQRFGAALLERDRERIAARVTETYQSARQFVDALTRRA